VATVSRKQDLTGVEARFMTEYAPGTFKITMISASMGGMIWNRERSSAVYPAPNDLIDDLAALQIDEIGALAASGVRWVQLDSLSYNQVIDPGATGRTRAALSPEQALDAAVTVDSNIVSAVKREHPDLTVGMHICRGNYRSSWMAQGGYEPLRFVPPGPTVVLGLVTTKVPELETRADLLRRIDEAARYVPLGQLALSPQCGFASGSLGNLIAVDDERRKLDLVVSVAGQVWG
jgi:5-methyltetrahydropteroyltriglutamate--homocysteine methyltransferase